MPSRRGTRSALRWMLGLAILAAAALPGIFGCRTVNAALQKRRIPCGVYRWRVKTLTDPEAEAIRFEPVDTTIHRLAWLPRPGPDHHRRRAEELSVYRIKAVVVTIQRRLDQDLHLRLRDPDDPDAHLVAEIPNPECARRSPYESAFAAARRVAESLRARGGRTLVEIEGVGFFDTFHVAIGGARNGFELHPVLKLTEIQPEESVVRTAPQALRGGNPGAHLRLEPKYKDWLDIAQPLLTEDDLSRFLQLSAPERDGSSGSSGSDTRSQPRRSRIGSVGP